MGNHFESIISEFRFVHATGKDFGYLKTQEFAQFSGLAPGDAYSRTFSEDGVESALLLRLNRHNLSQIDNV